MIYLKYLKSLLIHKWYVFCAGLKLGVPIWRLIVHDWSKFTPSEFLHYARNFHGERTEEVKLKFMYAWLHHENYNPHHWGYWIQRSGKFAGEPLEIPETYVREMIADWMGANMAYQNTWDMSEWINDNFSGKIKFHPGTWRLIHSILYDELGYSFDVMTSRIYL